MLPPSVSCALLTRKVFAIQRTRGLSGRAFQDEHAADIVWELDMCGRLGVFPHEACNSEVLAVGNLLIVATSNGRNEGHTRVPSPRAPV